MSTARDTGLAALQSGDTTTAIANLEVAVKEDPSDYDALCYLGWAYGKAERFMDSIGTFTQAVHLQPASAQARYNLGCAMEQGGYDEQALQVYDQAIQLQHEYPQAHDAIKRLEARSNDGFAAPTSGTQAPGQQTPQQQAAQAPQPQQQAAYAPQPQQQPGYTPPGQSQAGYAPPQQQAPGVAAGAPTQQMARPTAYSQQPAEEPGLGSYAAPPPPSSIQRPPFGRPPGPAVAGARPGGPMPYASVASYDDSYNIGQAVKDFFRALFTPRTLFEEMAGCESNSSTFALFTIYALLLLLVGVVAGLVSGAGPLSSLLRQVITIPVMLLVWAIFAVIVHLLSRAFGSSLNYGASFRSVVYSAAPYITSILILSVASSFMLKSVVNGTGAVSSLNTPPALTRAQFKTPPGAPGGRQFGRPGQSGANGFSRPGSAFGTPGGLQGGQMPANAGGVIQQMLGMVALILGIMGIGGIWSIGLLGVAVANIHEISGGSAAGVAILSAIIAFVIGVGAYFLIFASIIAGAMGGGMGGTSGMGGVGGAGGGLR